MNYNYHEYVRLSQGSYYNVIDTRKYMSREIYKELIYIVNINSVSQVWKQDFETPLAAITKKTDKKIILQPFVAQKLYPRVPKDL